ncbi:MAG: penicillin-binding protein [Patescibacteria group bacterium]|nr:penicillin-binding protein [Patescibacteria group bacterium]
MASFLNTLRRASTGLRKDLLIATFAVIAFLAIIPIFTYYYFVGDLADQTKLMSRNDRGIVLLDSQNRPFFQFYQGKLRDNVPLSQIPLDVQHAVIAMEDKDFYSHPGFSFKAMARSFLEDVRQKDLSYGASTITQQLVKNSLLNNKKSLLRKYQEVVLASEIERRYNKNQILYMYLSSVYFGEGAFGMEEAAQTYFHKPAKDLNLAESAMLAGLLSAPTKLSPISGDSNEAKLHQKLVLDRMVEQKYITKQQANEALDETLVFDPRLKDINAVAPHFALMVRDELVKKYGEEKVASSGFRVKTSLNLDYQKYAETIVATQVQKLAPNLVTNGAAVVLNPKTGEILAMVGSKDWYDDGFGKVNVTLSGRPPGSSFKPIVYVAAFEKGLITPATILQDRPTRFRNDTNLAAIGPNSFYSPVDFDRRFRGAVTVRRALANSLNVPAVEVMSKVGVPNTLEMAQRLGITTLKSPDDYGLSLVLGTGDVKLLELTNVYATFANHGYKNEPTSILQIDNKKGNTIYKYKPNPEKVLDEKDVFEITSTLSDNSARQEEFGNALTISRSAAVKTGTTEDFKDAWTLGYTPSLAVGVWVGNNNNLPMDQIAGSLGAAPIWKLLMEKYLAGTPVEKFDPPSGLVPMVVCPNGGVSEATPGAKIEYFVPGTQPRTRCPIISPSPSTPTLASPSPTPQASDNIQQPPTQTNPGTPGSVTQTVDPQTGQIIYQINL